MQRPRTLVAWYSLREAVEVAEVDCCPDAAFGVDTPEQLAAAHRRGHTPLLTQRAPHPH